MPKYDIYTEACKLMGGEPVKGPDRRGWMHFWCPFHPDAERRGKRGNPNFGINVNEGNWKCFVCGKKGGSLYALAKALGKDGRYLRQATMSPGPRNSPQEASSVPYIAEAISVARSALFRSPVWPYLTQERGVLPETAAVYGLGYGVPYPKVSKATYAKALEAKLATKRGWWLWAEGIVYAEPPTNPITIQVRHTRENAPHKYQTWGPGLAQPMGAWRCDRDTRTIVVVEGMIDMLIIAQALTQRDLKHVRAVYTAGATPSYTMLGWFTQHPEYEYILIADPDNAGLQWIDTVSNAIKEGGAEFVALFPPNDLDPDEAILKGWWPGELS
ncbi:hypothetical protein D6833_07200 [Candidatus Parcubacteria bacterium]|nr:MAG: hypothetical protein D6833_07200 [Candidatus Parcubacteria bacterium]